MLNPLILVLAGLVFAVSLGLFLWLNRVFDKRRAERQRRLQGTSSDSDAELSLDAALAPPPQGWMGRMDIAFASMVRRSGLEVEPEQALALIALVAVGLAAILFLWRGELWLSVVGLLLGGVGTLIVFLVLQNRYRRQLSEQMPDAFYLLARSLRAGLSMEQSIALTGEQGAKPLADEFRRCAAQLRLGLAIPSALDSIAKRIQLLDFNIFVSTVTLHHTMGGNLALLLDRLAASTRDRNQFRGYFKTATALSRITALAIGVISPLLLLYYAIFQPEHVRAFFESPAGWTALIVAGVLQVVGILWLYSLLRVEY